MRTLILTTLILVLAGCQDLTTEGCDCQVEYQTTRSGSWTTESHRVEKELWDDCDQGDRVDVIVQPVIINTPLGTVMTSDGIREIIDCN